MGAKVKVVFNRTFGGFSLSKEAILALDELGLRLDCFGEIGGEPVERHDPRLVQVVERLGFRAHGRWDTAGDTLGIEELSGDRYIIDDYDGREQVIEPHNIRWCVVEKEE